VIEKSQIAPLRLQIARDELSVLFTKESNSNIEDYIEAFEDLNYLYIVKESMPDAVNLQQLIDSNIDEKSRSITYEEQLIFPEDAVRCIM
jgi:hypothetical protein